MRTGTDECNLGAVNLDGQASLDTGAELPDEGKPAASQRSTCGFQGYGKLESLDGRSGAILLMYQLAFLVGRTFGRERDDVGIPGFDHEPDLEARLEHLESDFGHTAQCHAGYGKLWLNPLSIYQSP